MSPERSEKFSKQALDLFIFTQTKEQSEMLSCSRLLAVAFPPEEEEMGHPAAGREERRRRPMASRAARHGDHWYAVYLYPHRVFTLLLWGRICVFVSLARWVFDGSPQPKKEKKLLDFTYVMRPIVGLVDANSLRLKQTNLV